MWAVTRTTAETAAAARSGPVGERRSDPVPPSPWPTLCLGGIVPPQGIPIGIMMWIPELPDQWEDAPHAHADSTRPRSTSYRHEEEKKAGA